MPEILCIGSAVMDIVAHPVGDSLGWKEKQRISSIRIQPGGDAVNQSIRLADAGRSAALLACIGDDANGGILRSLLKKRGVETGYLTERTDVSTGTALVLVDEDGNRHTFSVYGAHSTLGREQLPIGRLDATVRAISLASLFSMPEAEADGLLEFLQYVKSSVCKDVKVFADLAFDKNKQGLDGVRPFLPYLDYFLPSLYDAIDITGASNAAEAASVFRALGVAHVVIKCGSEGCYCSYGDQCGQVPAIRVKPVDTTGAGDCMVALFIDQILKQKDVETACRYACAGASLSTLYMGASEHPLPDFEKEMRDGDGGMRP